MPGTIMYKVVRLPGPEDHLQQQLDEQGARGWDLVAILHEPVEGAGPYLCIFKR